MQPIPLSVLPQPVVSRAKQVCNYCRDRKIKCDRTLPTCSSCKLRRRSCHYGLPPVKQRRSEGQLRRHVLVPIRPGSQPARPPLPATAPGPSPKTRPCTTSPSGSSNSVSPEGPATSDEFRRIEANPPNPSRFASDWLAKMLNSSASHSAHRPAERLFRRLFDKVYQQNPLPLESPSPSVDWPGYINSLLGSLPRCLYTTTDLLFHSHVIDEHIFLFCRFLYPGLEVPHYQRILHRRKIGVVSPVFALAVAMMMAPLSTHDIFAEVHPFLAGNRYYQQLSTLLPDYLVSEDPDSLIVLTIIAEYHLGLGNVNAHASFLSAAIRKFQLWRGHVMDHPDLPPLPPSSTTPTTTLDLTRITHPILREHYRTQWWHLYGNDVATALVFGHRPVINPDDVCVLAPTVSPSTCSLTLAAISDPLSEMQTSPQCPTFITRSWDPKGTGLGLIECYRIMHRVAIVWSDRRDGPARWATELPVINQDMDSWYLLWSDYRSLTKPQPRGPVNKDGPAPPASDETACLIDFHSYLGYIVACFFTNHIPCEYSQTHPHDPVDPRLIAECKQRRWNALQWLRQIMDDTPTIAASQHTSLFLGALYTAAVICIDIIRHSTDSFRVTWARRFVKDTIEFLSQYGLLRFTDLKIAQVIRQMLECPNVPLSPNLHFS